MDIRRVGGWVSVLGLTALFAFSAFRCGSEPDSELRVLRARAAKLEARQTAARAAVNAAYESSGGNWDLLRDVVRRAEWLSGEECAELNAIRERIDQLESRQQSQGGQTRSNDGSPSGSANSAASNEPSGT